MLGGLLALGIGGVTVHAARPLFPSGIWRGAAPGAPLVNALDRCVQQRFATVEDDRFGTSREVSLTFHEPLKGQKGASPAELAALGSLRAARWDAVFLLVARDTRSVPPALASAPGAPLHPARTPPALPKLVLTGTVPRVPLPEDAELRPRAEAALAAFATRSSYEFRTGAWHVVARPIRASGRQCLSCHRQDASGRPIRVGDPLATALYAFTRASP